MTNPYTPGAGDREGGEPSGLTASGAPAAPKTHLERLRDQHSAALSQVKYWQEKAAKLEEEIQTIQHRERGVEVGYVVENRDGRAVVDRLNKYWLWGRFLKKDGTPGARERVIYTPFKVLAKSLDSLEAARRDAPEASSPKGSIDVTRKPILPEGFGP